MGGVQPFSATVPVNPPSKARPRPRTCVSVRTRVLNGSDG